MNPWKDVTAQNDIDELFATYRGFHDSCIASVRFQSGAFVDEEKVMHFGSASDRELLITFHSQWTPRAIELCFTGLRQLHLTGWQNNYFCDIFDAYLSFHTGLLPGMPERVIVWADFCEFDVDKIDNTLHEPSSTYVIANALKWRIVDDSV